MTWDWTPVSESPVKWESVTNPILESEAVVAGADVAEKYIRTGETPVSGPKFAEFFIAVPLRIGGLLTDHGLLQ